MAFTGGVHTVTPTQRDFTLIMPLPPFDLVLTQPATHI